MCSGIAEDLVAALGEIETQLNLELVVDILSKMWNKAM